jgi:hypothetical protein
MERRDEGHVSFNADIWRLQVQGDVRGLIEVLRQGDADLRGRAAMALRALGTASAIPALQDAILAESEPSVHSLLVATLESILDQQAGEGMKSTGGIIAHLIARLNSPIVEHAVRAAQELAERQEKLAVEALMITFNNLKLAARVRLAAAEALLKLESAPMDVTLLRALRSPNWYIRRSAAAMLGQMESDWAVEPLTVALRDVNERVQSTARAALEHIGTPEALRAIEGARERTESQEAPITSSQAAVEGPQPPANASLSKGSDHQPAVSSQPSVVSHQEASVKEQQTTDQTQVVIEKSAAATPKAASEPARTTAASVPLAVTVEPPSQAEVSKPVSESQPAVRDAVPTPPSSSAVENPPPVAESQSATKSPDLTSKPTPVETAAAPTTSVEIAEPEVDEVDTRPTSPIIMNSDP